MSKNKRLTRSSSDRKILGVCGGIGDYFNIDSTLVRIIFLVSFFSLGVGLIPYFIMALLIPYDYQVSGYQGRRPSNYSNFKERQDQSASRPRQDVTPDDEDDWSDF